MCFSISLLLGDSLASMTFLPPSLLTIGPSIFTTKNKRIASQWERGGKGRRKREREGEGVWGRGGVGVVLITPPTCHDANYNKRQK